MFDTYDAISRLEFVGSKHFPEWAHKSNVKSYCPQVHMAKPHDHQECQTPYCISLRRLHQCHAELVSLVDAEVVNWPRIHDLLNSHFTDYCKLLHYALKLIFRSCVPSLYLSPPMWRRRQWQCAFQHGQLYLAVAG